MTPLFAFATFLNLVVAQSLRGTSQAWILEGWVENYRFNWEYPTFADIERLHREYFDEN